MSEVVVMRSSSTRLYYAGSEPDTHDKSKARLFKAGAGAAPYDGYVFERVFNGKTGTSPGYDPNLVILESPFAGQVSRNICYARRCMADSIARGEAPFASHLLYTQEGILDDRKPDEREKGILAGLAWGARAHATVVYTDYGITPGMKFGIDAATKAGRPIFYRTILAKK
jgi:hypothetical protein